MRTPILKTLTLALALSAALAPTANAEFRFRKPARTPRPPATVTTLSGRLSGAIGADMQIDGLTYRVSPSARILEMGRGEVPSGTAFYDRVVTVTAEQVRGQLVVTSVLVRPASFGSWEGRAGMKEESGPR